MPTQAREWSVPAPVRALLWWPALSFVLVILVPDAGTGSIVLAGATLAALGGLLSAAARRLRTPVIDDQPTREFPTIEMPRTQEDRAA